MPDINLLNVSTLVNMRVQIGEILRNFITARDEIYNDKRK